MDVTQEQKIDEPGMPSVRSKWIRWSSISAATLLLGAMGYMSSWWYSCGFNSCPDSAFLQEWNPRSGDRLLTHDGELLGVLDPVKRIPVELKDIPAHVKDAFVVVEDRRFREHGGVDLKGVLRSAAHNVKAFGVRQGASTITMQLARNAFLTNNTRGFARKLLEVRYAWLLEDALDKDRILELYLNTIYFGNGTWGIEAASRDLLGKTITKANLADAALLAGLPKAPSSYTPRASTARAQARRDVVLSVLVETGVTDSATASEIANKPVRVSKKKWEPDWPQNSWATETVSSVLDSLVKSGAIPAVNRQRNLKIYTTVDARAQRSAERALSAGALRADRANGTSSSGPNATQGALVAMDPASGGIRAIVGGRQVERKGFNRALSAKRQSGSAFKPFVYAAALTHGYAGNRILSDDPLSIKVGQAMWTPTNFDGQFTGKMTMRTALATSSNTATVRLAQDIGNGPIIAVAKANGIESSLPDVPSLALGSASLTPMELVTAYLPFGNGGLRREPHIVTRVETSTGQLLWEREAGFDAVRAMSAEDAFLVTSMLRSAVDEGTGRTLRDLGIRGPVAGKTGTSNEGADVWFVGYSPSLATVVWLGADRPRSLGSNASGSRLAAPVWAQFMKSGWRSPDRDMPWMPPSTLTSRVVDRNSGLLASDWCGEPQLEWFREGAEPKASCEGSWFRFTGSDAEQAEAAIDAAAEALSEAIGEGAFRQAVLRALRDEMRKRVR